MTLFDSRHCYENDDEFIQYLKCPNQCKQIVKYVHIYITRHHLNHYYYHYHKTLMLDNYNCDSANVVYLIQCQKYPEAQYIGETGGNFRYRFNNHTHSIRQKKLLPLPLHFNLDGHYINDLKVCILKGNFKDTRHRKLTLL